MLEVKLLSQTWPVTEWAVFFCQIADG